MAAVQPSGVVGGADEFPELFEGPEKTLSLCFKARKIAARSLRLIPQEAWEDILKHAKCEILSVVDSNRAFAPKSDHKKSDKAVSTKGLTGYLLSESSLFLSDTTLTLKTCGRTTPLAALEPILDLVVPSWKDKHPERYLKYVSFMRLGYMRPDEQLEPHTSWDQEVGHMDKYFDGEAVVLGSPATSTQHVYVANYLPKDEIMDTVSCQVALTNLDTRESMHRYGGGEKGLAPGVDRTPLATAWPLLHGDAKRCISADPRLDECFFEPIGYSANGVAGRHFTTIHITPQQGCSYISVETSMPMNHEARKRFVHGSQGMCRADTMAVTEFALSAKLFAGGPPPDVPGFEVQRSTQTVGTTFACAHHHYERKSAQAAKVGDATMASPVPSQTSTPVLEASSEEPQLPREAWPVLEERLAHVEIEASSNESCAVSAAKRFLVEPGDPSKDLPVALLDLSVLGRQADLWQRLLPRVEPFYAVKCNPHPAVVKTLWHAWQERGMGGFDCASTSEIELVTSLGANAVEQIVFANPCKQASSIRAARTAGVRRLVFDNAAELGKLADLYPDSELLLRVQTDDSLTQCPLSNKFGAAPADCAALLGRARALGLKVVGVSFHVGSGCSQRGAFRGALRRARAVFDEAEQQGFTMNLLDIGGGFPGWDEVGQATFADHAVDINEMLETLFPSPSLRIVAEPGRFFAATAQAMLATVVSVAESSTGDRYYLNDGLYGAFNCLLYDHASVPRPNILRDGQELSDQEQGTEGPCTIFGPTCDGFDMISDSMPLPRLRVGDRLVFPNMGAYTSAASTSFNGFAPATSYIYESCFKAKA